MLTELHISNFAIIDDLVIPFGPGLNVLTGETGAGKSIMVEALSLVVGDRVASDVVRAGSIEATVVAFFDGKSLPASFVQRCEEKGYHLEETVVIKRIVSENGRSRAYLNNTPITIADLKSVSSYLLEISSQHEHQRLLNQETHLHLVDQFGGTNKNLEEYKTVFSRCQQIHHQLKEMEALALSASEQRDFLSYQIREIEAAALKENEEEELFRERNMAKHAAKLTETMSAVDASLSSSATPIVQTLEKVGEWLKEAATVDSKIGEWTSLSDEATVAASELARSVSGYLQSIDIDPERLEVVEARLFEVRRLKKKYGDTVPDILQKCAEFKERLELIDNSDVEIERLNSELRDERSKLATLAKQLSKKRVAAAKKMVLLIQQELESLGLKKTTFAPGHQTIDIDNATEKGIDLFDFQLSPNPGEPLRPLARIASGGELSRIMLAIKRVFSDMILETALEVFDEVDVGIGGAVAEMVGQKLGEMSKNRQVICITHLPQVASFGDHHIQVSKEPVKDRTVTRFHSLNDTGRVEELARMLGGAKITKTTLSHAKEMLERGRKS